MRDSRELKICESCDYGHSMAIFRGSPVACKVDKLIHQASDCCNNWKQLTMETIQKDMDAKMREMDSY